MPTATGDFAATADAIAAAALTVPGVEGLHGGALGEIATALPCRRVAGLRLDADTCAVHVAVRWGTDMREAAAALRTALRPLAGGREVAVTFEDIGPPAEDPSEDGASGDGERADSAASATGTSQGGSAGGGASQGTTLSGRTPTDEDRT